MNQKRSRVVVAVVVLVVAAVVWAGGRMLWNGLAALHGQH